MKLIRSEENNYYFEDKEGNEIIITSDSESQAIETSILIENRPAPDPIANLKSQLLSEVKNKAKELLSSTDYKVTRHEEQLKIGVETSLTAQEYTDLLTLRNEIRKNSNKFEAEIQGKRTIQTLSNYKIEY